MEMKTRQITVLAVLALMSIFAIAGVVTYLSNTVTATAVVSSPVELSQLITNPDGELVEGDTVSAYGGEFIQIQLVGENKSNVTQTGQYVLTITPAMQVSGYGIDGEEVGGTGEVSTIEIPVTTISELGSESKTVGIQIASDAEPTTYTITSVYNVAEVEEPPVVE
jgi:hypothetical protein